MDLHANAARPKVPKADQKGGRSPGSSTMGEVIRWNAIAGCAQALYFSFLDDRHSALPWTLPDALDRMKPGKDLRAGLKASVISAGFLMRRMLPLMRLACLCASL